MTEDRKTHLLNLINSGVELTPEQDEDAYALLPAEEYLKAIRSTEKRRDELQYLQVDLSRHGQHVVYALEINNQKTYCGISIYENLFKIQDAIQNSIVREWTNNNPFVKIIILSYENSLENAKIKHKENLNKFDYYANIHGKIVEDKRLNKIKCLTDGNEYESIAEAARFYAVSSTMISNHVNKRAGYAKVRGLVFERINKDENQ